MYDEQNYKKCPAGTRSVMLTSDFCLFLPRNTQFLSFLKWHF